MFVSSSLIAAVTFDNFAETLLNVFGLSRGLIVEKSSLEQRLSFTDRTVCCEFPVLVCGLSYEILLLKYRKFLLLVLAVAVNLVYI